MAKTSVWALAFILAESCGVLAAEVRGIPQLLRAMEAEDTQFEAISELEDLGLDAAPAVPQLIQLLDAPDKETRKAALRALEAIGKDATAAIPKLVERLGEGELPQVSTEVGEAYDKVGILAASALGKMGQDAVAPLERALTDKRSAVRSNAASALENIGPDARAAVPSLIRLLKDRDELVRERAVWAIRSINADAALTVPSLVEILADRNLNIRVAATSALGVARPMTRAVVEGLIRALHDEAGDAEHEAAEALGKLGVNAIPAIPALTEMLKSKKAYRYSHPVLLRPVAGTAARALGALGPRAKEAMPALLDLIRDKRSAFERYGANDKCDNYEARGEAAIAAARIDPQSDDLVRILRQSLQEDDSIRRNVAVALALIGPKAKGAVPLLIRLSQTNSRLPAELNCACAAVVIEPDNTAAIEKVLENLPPKPPFDDEDWILLRTALARGGGRSRQAIPVMIELARNSTEDQKNAACTLAVFGPAADRAIPALLDLLDSRWEHPRQEAIAALGQIASERSLRLLAARKSPNANVRSGVVEVLGRFSDALPLIAETLDDSSARVRLAALLSLAKLEGRARPAVPKIRGLLQADSRTIREAAALALQNVEQGGALR